ncbi:uncharacterized protein V1516DRAFT_667527, partial [Lipomyces oligophaga]|uniref:uncharacterized protein n=1 Tax=Lipomyces oligophaga TaxID=45792 RepID=UPI0034CEA6F3
MASDQRQQGRQQLDSAIGLEKAKLDPPDLQDQHQTSSQKPSQQEQRDRDRDRDRDRVLSAIASPARVVAARSRAIALPRLSRTASPLLSPRDTVSVSALGSTTTSSTTAINGPVSSCSSSSEDEDLAAQIDDHSSHSNIELTDQTSVSLQNSTIPSLRTSPSLTLFARPFTSTSSDGYISSPSTPVLFPQMNPFGRRRATSITDDEMSVDSPAQTPTDLTPMNSGGNGSASNSIFFTPSSFLKHQQTSMLNSFGSRPGTPPAVTPAPTSQTSPNHGNNNIVAGNGRGEINRRAVVFSRLGGGSMKPQIRSFMRISKELADELAPAEVEIKHEAEVTMLLRDDEDISSASDTYEDRNDYEDDDDDDDDDAVMGYADNDDDDDDDDEEEVRLRKQWQRQRQRFNAKYRSAYPALDPTPSSSSYASFSGAPPLPGFPGSGLLASPPFRRRRRRHHPTTSKRDSDTGISTGDTTHGQLIAAAEMNGQREISTTDLEASLPTVPTGLVRPRPIMSANISIAQQQAISGGFLSDGMVSPLSISPSGRGFVGVRSDSDRIVATPTAERRTLKRRGPIDDSPRLSATPSGSAAAAAAAVAAASGLDHHGFSIKRRAVSPSIPAETTSSSSNVGGPNRSTNATAGGGGSPGPFVAGKRSMKHMQEAYDRIQKMSL